MGKKEIVAMILAGGQGSRLGVLTKRLAKPAVPFGGKYRIIDFPLSNCSNSGIYTVGVLTQYKPLELNTIVNKYYKLDDNFTPDDLIYINDTYANTSDPAYKYRKHQMRKVVYDDFIALKEACKTKGFNLYVVSGYRSTTWQTEIYNHMVNTYSVAKADQTCSRPGHSEHTTGLACDIALDNYSFEDVIKHPQYQWFLGQLANYGFIIRYPENKDTLTGYSYESWHLRYLGKDLAKKVTASNLTYDEYYAQNYAK